MIIIFSRHPSKMNQADGFTQRIYAIDSLLMDKERCYVTKIGLDQWLKKKFFFWNKKYNDDCLEGVKMYSLHPVISYFTLRKLRKKSVTSYFHSLYNVRNNEEFIIGVSGETIIDVHGVVPEEKKMAGDKDYEIYKNIEESTFPHFSKFICVTERMAAHYISKYKINPENIIILPIFEKYGQLKRNEPNEKPSILYAGGGHKWQNIEMMCQAAKKLTDQYDFTFLTGDRKAFREYLTEEDLNKIHLSYAEGEKLRDFFALADFGLVLRDEHIVNNVACPTKIIEYLSYGLIPIVIQPEIGDFNRHGYRYCLYSDLIKGKLPSAAEQKEMRQHNYRVVQLMYEQKEVSEKSLTSI